MIDWSLITKDEHAIVCKIAERAQRLFKTRTPAARRATVMDVEAAHLACPLRLQDLLEADDFNFVHDVAGISRHLNRKTGELDGCFLPRFAQHQGGNGDV